MLWDASKAIKKKIYKIAVFSIDVNTALAGTIHKESSDIFGLFTTFFTTWPYRMVSLLKIFAYLGKSIGQIESTTNNAFLMFHFNHRHTPISCLQLNNNKLPTRN